jgi:uncharacterized protein (DUF58 family)
MPLFGPDFLARLEHLALTARRSRASAGGAGAVGRRIGDGLEFADHREYVAGDELRYLDWAAFGRLERLFVRRFHQHSDRVVHVLVDASASMGLGVGERSAPGRAAGPSKFDAARRIAAALAYLALNNLDRTAVAGFRDGRPDEAAASARGRDQIFPVLSYLERLACGGGGRWPDALRMWADRSREPGLVIVVSDLLEEAPVEPALEAAAAGGHEVRAVAVAAPSELDPQAAEGGAGGRLRLIDVETSQELRPTMSASLAEAYRAEAEACRRELADAFAARRAALVRTTSDTPFEEFLTELLARGWAGGE